MTVIVAVPRARPHRCTSGRTPGPDQLSVASDMDHVYEPKRDPSRRWLLRRHRVVEAADQLSLGPPPPRS